MILEPAIHEADQAAPFSMRSLPDGYHALVNGGSGAIGSALVALLRADFRCASVRSLHRHSHPAIDYTNEASIAAAIAHLARGPRFNLVVNATGLLHSGDMMPEKRLADLNYAHLQAVFQANAFGPALFLRHVAALLAPERALVGTLSAKVGSIGDNRLGGWYSYRASKAALNMLVKTAAIELARTQPNSVLVALHPGTVESRLSEPFRSVRAARHAQEAALDLLRVLDATKPGDSGAFLAYDGSRLPW